MFSPKRRALLECLPFFYPFGNTPSHNALEGLEMVAEPAAGDGGDNKILNVRKIEIQV